MAELETQLKAANMSDKVNRTIEDRLTSINVSTNSRVFSSVMKKSVCQTILKNMASTASKEKIK